MTDTFVNPVRRAVGGHALLATASMRRDLKAIGDNYSQCRACQGRWFALHCAIDAVHRFLAPRLITTAVVVAAVWAVAAALA